MIRSQKAADPVNLMTVTIVRPPFVAILKVRVPASRYCAWSRLKLTWPLPFGPPTALYVGIVPTAALLRVDIDVNEGLGVSAINLSLTVVGYGKMTFCGLLLSPQQSSTTVVPDSAMNPTGQLVHVKATLPAYVFAGHTLHAAGPEAFLNVPAAHATHGPPFGPVYPGLQEQSVMLVLPKDEFAFAVQLVHAALPFVGLYVPDGQIAHWPFEALLSGPV